MTKSRRQKGEEFPETSPREWVAFGRAVDKIT